MSGKVKHIVLFKLKSDTTQQQKDNLFESLASLKTQISGIEDFAFGTNNSTEGFSKGYTHGFTMVFTDVKARDDYLPHPIHEALVKEVFLPLIDDVCVFDFDL